MAEQCQFVALKMEKLKSYFDPRSNRNRVLFTVVSQQKLHVWAAEEKNAVNNGSAICHVIRVGGILENPECI